MNSALSSPKRSRHAVKTKQCCDTPLQDLALTSRAQDVGNRVEAPYWQTGNCQEGTQQHLITKLAGLIGKIHKPKSNAHHLQDNRISDYKTPKLNGLNSRDKLI